ncbi:hypothetical protein DICVIV_10987 [Dictyocaulus viviparus]|uniref:Uncharacterized protein n=1 Tax=Dictyocaulus viviparus TaxID=29172 RepID=A0A0D8XH17_DICVI|nr:hypothetical protein DICVIV_10987 [Dictyocaulus viviparus]
MNCKMIRIARELSESDQSIFSILEDVCIETGGKYQRDIAVQTEISCNDAPLVTEVSIRSHDQREANETSDLLFWRAVATQRANELDLLREDISKIRELIIKNVTEKEGLDKKYDELYHQLRDILEDDSDDVQLQTSAKKDIEPTVRLGLKQVSNSNTSPPLSILHTKKINCTQSISPVKAKYDVKKKTTLAPNVDNKENQSVQATMEVTSSYAQTDVLAIKPTSSVSKEDLLCEEATSCYWREMAERFEKEIDLELETSFNMSLELDRSYEELTKSEERLKTLMEVLDDILNDVKTDEVDTDK